MNTKEPYALRNGTASNNGTSEACPLPDPAPGVRCSYAEPKANRV